MKQLMSNKELYEYLVDLSSKLRARGCEPLAASVLAASRQAAGLSTEFLGESRIALRNVSDSDQAVLSGSERTELSDILNQLTIALDRRQSRSNREPK